VVVVRLIPPSARPANHGAAIINRIDFADGSLVACAEATGVELIASFDRVIDRVTTVRRAEPS